MSKCDLKSQFRHGCSPVNLLHIFLFFCNNVVHKIQTIFTTNKIKRNNYNKTWDYTNTMPITTRGSLGLNTKKQEHKKREREKKKKCNKANFSLPPQSKTKLR